MSVRPMTEPVILFDFGGTLDADGIRWSVRFYEAYRGVGGKLDFAAFEPLFQRSDELLAQLPGVRSLGFHATAETQARLLGRLLPDAREISLSAIAKRFYTDSLATVARNRPLLERLADRYRLGVISNFTGNLVPCLEELDLARFFRVMLDSAIEKIEKPDARLFRRALDALSAQPASGWMVGDNFAADIQPAQMLGMHACWVAPADRAAPAGRPARRITRLPQFEQLLAEESVEVAQ
jgi:HAD superfamily hydrolase (TIGR01549 family)